MTLEGRFFSPINGIGLSGRDDWLTLMSLDSIYPKDSRIPMKFPKDFVMKLPVWGTTQFKWDMAINKDLASIKQWTTVKANLQKMIDFLQNPMDEARQFNPFNETALTNHPWILELMEHSLAYRANSEIRNKNIKIFIKAILDDFSIETVDIFLKNYHSVIRYLNTTDPESRKLISKITNRLVNTPSLWEDYKRFADLANYFLTIHPSSDWDASKNIRFMDLTNDPKLKNLLKSYTTLLPPPDLEKIDLVSYGFVA
jgi:hypothetical protein